MVFQLFVVLFVCILKSSIGRSTLATIQGASQEPLWANEFRLLCLVGGGGSRYDGDPLHEVFRLAVFIFWLECCDLDSLRFGPEASFLKNGGEGALEGFVVVCCEVESEEVVGVEGGVARGVKEEVLGVEDELGFGIGGGFG